MLTNTNCDVRIGTQLIVPVGVQLRELLVVIRGHNGQVNLLRGAVSLATITETGLRSTLPSEARPFTPHAFLNRAINSSSSA